MIITRLTLPKDGIYIDECTIWLLENSKKVVYLKSIEICGSWHGRVQTAKIFLKNQSLILSVYM